MKIIPFVDSEMTAVIDNLNLFWGRFAFRYFEWYTHFYRIREEGGSGHSPPPPPSTIHLRTDDVT